MNPLFTTLALVSRMLPYVVKVLELVARISSDKAVQARLRKRALEMTFEAADNLIAQLEDELQSEVEA